MNGHGHENHGARSAAHEPGNAAPQPHRRQAHPAGHGGHDHGAMIADYRRRFWLSLAIPLAAGVLYKQGVPADAGARRRLHVALDRDRGDQRAAPRPAAVEAEARLKDPPLLPGRLGSRPSGSATHLGAWRQGPLPFFRVSRMKRIGRSRIVALALLVVLAGLPGLLQAACPGCEASQAVQSSPCHGERAAKPHSPCCDGFAWKPAGSCCGQMAAAEPGPATRAATAPSAPVLSLVSPATAPATSVRRDDARRMRLPESPPLHQGIGLHVLHSAFLI
jgi:hypothetical protein